MTSFRTRPYPPPRRENPAEPDLEALKRAFAALTTEAGRLAEASMTMAEFQHARYIGAEIERLRLMIRSCIKSGEERKQLGLFG